MVVPAVASAWYRYAPSLLLAKYSLMLGPLFLSTDVSPTAAGGGDLDAATEKYSTYVYFNI